MADQDLDTRTDQILLWQMLSTRRAGYDQLLWQAPALGMTAQAFLMTLALGAGVSAWGRALAATLGLALSVLGMQLQVKHRKLEMLDSLTLEQLERRIGFRGVGDYCAHEPYSALPLGAAEDLVAGRMRSVTRMMPERFWRLSSFSLWVYGEAAFALVALLILALVLTGHGGLLA